MIKSEVVFMLIISLFTDGPPSPAKAGNNAYATAKACAYVPHNRDLDGNLPYDLFADSIAIHKSAHELLVFRDKELLKKYIVHLGVNPVGPKQCAGDLKTPEGLYFISYKNHSSKFHKSLGISYPNKMDLVKASRLGKSPGGDIMIHGLPNGEENVGPDRYNNDWTWGCVALRNIEIEELFDHVEVGTPLLITP